MPSKFGFEYDSYTTPLSSPIGNEQYIFNFPNGYGASVIRGSFTYGGKDDLWEIAVLDAVGHLDYSTPVTSDVIGYQNESEVESVLKQIEALPAK